ISSVIFTTLAGMIARDLARFRRRLEIRIGSTGAIRKDDIEFLRARTGEAVSRCRSVPVGPFLHTCADRTYTIKVRPLEASFSRQTLPALEEGLSFHSTLLIGEEGPDRTYKLQILVGVESRPSENTWLTLRRSISEASRQLRDGPP